MLNSIYLYIKKLMILLVKLIGISQIVIHLTGRNTKAKRKIIFYM